MNEPMELLVDGNIWAIHPSAEHCETCDTYHLGPCHVALDEQIEEIVGANVAYVETHTDSGNNYLECISECNFDDRLKEFIRENEIDLRGLEIDELARLLIDHLEPVSSHIFGSVPSNVFVADSWPLQEIETQIKLSALEVTPKQFLDYTKQSNEHCISYREGSDTFEVYAASDVVWQAQVSADTIIEVIDDEIERTREQF